jgi:hypothetical protein
MENGLKRKIIKMREIELYWDCKPDEYEGIKITLYPTKQENDFETILVNEEDHLYEITCDLHQWYLENVDANFEDSADEDDFEEYESLIWHKLEESGQLKQCLCDIINDNQDNYEWVYDLRERAEQILTNQGNSVEELYLIAAVNSQKLSIALENMYEEYRNNDEEEDD